MSKGMRTLCYWLEGVLLALTAALIMEGALSLHVALGYLIAINVFAFIYYGIDKLNSIYEDESPRNKAEKVRITEPALLLLALAGGSPAAAAAIVLLPHKTNKGWFLTWFVAIIAIQGVAVYTFWDKLPWV